MEHVGEVKIEIGGNTANRKIRHQDPAFFLVT